MYLTNTKHLLFNNLHAAIPPLDGQTCPEVGWKWIFFPDLRHETRQQVVVEVGWRDLQSYAGSVTDLVMYLTNAKHLLFNNLHAAIPPLDGQTCPEVGWKWIFFPDLRHETRQQVVVEVGCRDLQSCWECY